jgi:hypothetical protein
MTPQQQAWDFQPRIKPNPETNYWGFKGIGIIILDKNHGYCWF